jgi:hypothetical protein
LRTLQRSFQSAGKTRPALEIDGVTAISVIAIDSLPITTRYAITSAPPFTLASSIAATVIETSSTSMPWNSTSPTRSATCGVGSLTTCAKSEFRDEQALGQHWASAIHRPLSSALAVRRRYYIAQRVENNAAEAECDGTDGRCRSSHQSQQKSGGFIFLVKGYVYTHNDSAKSTILQNL